MILNDDDIKERIESPINLLNRLRTSLSRATSGGYPAVHSIVPSDVTNSPSDIPALPPKSEDIIPDLEDKIRNATAKTKAMSVMVTAMDELRDRLPEVKKPEALANIAFNMSRVIGAVDDKRVQQSNITSQIIVYAPQVQSLDNFEVIDVTE